MAPVIQAMSPYKEGMRMSLKAAAQALPAAVLKKAPVNCKFMIFPIPIIPPMSGAWTMAAAALLTMVADWLSRDATLTLPEMQSPAPVLHRIALVAISKLLISQIPPAPLMWEGQI